MSQKKKKKKLTKLGILVVKSNEKRCFVYFRHCEHFGSIFNEFFFSFLVRLMHPKVQYTSSQIGFGKNEDDWMLYVCSLRSELIR